MVCLSVILSCVCTFLTGFSYLINVSVYLDEFFVSLLLWKFITNLKVS